MLEEKRRPKTWKERNEPDSFPTWEVPWVAILGGLVGLVAFIANSAIRIHQAIHGGRDVF